MLLAAIGLSLAASGLKGAMAWLVKPAMDYFFVPDRREYLFMLPAGIFTVYALRGIADCSHRYLMARAGMALVRDLRNRIFANLVNMPVSRAARLKSGDIISRQLMDIALFEHILSDSLCVFLVEFPTVVVLIGVAFSRRWDISLFSFVFLPFVAMSARFFGRFVKKRRIEVQEYLARITHRMTEAYHGLRIIKVFGMIDAKIAQFRHENQRVFRQDAQVFLFKQGTRLFIDIISGMAVSIVVGWGGLLIAEGRMTTGDLFSLIAAMGMLFLPLKRLGSAYNIYQESMGVFDRIEEYATIQTESMNGLSIGPLRQAITIEGVGFTYPGSDEPALQNIDLIIPAGKMTAIIGPSGSGKSTLVDLMCGFMSPDTGRILWDGLDIKTADPSALRAMIGLVSQDIVLFSDTVRENIAAGRPEASDKEIAEAACAANAHEFIMALPNGYDTILDERGLNLSGGQRQRISLARAILKNPSLLILDEATSALDAVSEQAIQKALLNFSSGHTILVIAHRLSTIKKADMIIVLERGRIVATGDHHELILSSPLYQRLFHAGLPTAHEPPIVA